MGLDQVPGRGAAAALTGHRWVEAMVGVALPNAGR